MLPLPAQVAGLVPGDILALRQVSGAVLRLDTFRDFCAYPWHCHSAALRDGYLQRLLSHPLTHITGEGVIPIPSFVFPLREGTRILLMAMDRGTKRAFYLARAGADD